MDTGCLFVGRLVSLGVLTQGACLLAAASCLFAMLWDEQAYTNHFWLTTLLVTYLAFAKSDAQWSLRAAARGRLPSSSPVPVFLMVTQLSVCYLFAGLSKLNPWWIAGDELRWSLRFEAPDALYTPLALLVICSELFLATAIWFRRTRRLALLVGILLHSASSCSCAIPFHSSRSRSSACPSTRWWRRPRMRVTSRRPGGHPGAGWLDSPGAPIDPGSSMGFPTRVLRG